MLYSERVEKAGLVEKTACARLKAVKGSVQKVNLVAKTIVNLPVEQAVNVLFFSQRRHAKDLLETLKSAISNAENNMMLDIDRLVVSKVRVGKSFVLKRFHARGRGKAASVKKHYSNIEIFVSEV